MEKWFCCCVVFGLAVVAIIKAPKEHVQPMLEKLISPKDDTVATKQNHTTIVTNTRLISKDGLDDISNARTCILQTREALSAIHRATSEECREKLQKVACLDQEKKLYPDRLPRFCPLKGEYERGTYIGCYKDSKTERDMDGLKEDFPVFNSPNTCINYCLTEGHKYAALQWKTECWCSNTYGRYGTLPEWACSTPCPGNKSETCGGSNSNRVFSTGLPARQSVQSEVVYFKSQVEGLKPVRIVFVLTVYGRAVRQVKRLIKLIYRPYHYFYIHVDSRSSYMYRELVKLEHVLPNVRFARQRFATVWGGISLLEAHLSFMKALLDMTDWTWDYYMNLSESDYPIKPLRQLEWYLTKYKGNNFIAIAEMDASTQDQGIVETFYECDHRVWHLGKRDLLKDISFYVGSDWIILYRDFVEYAMADSDQLVRGLKQIYRFTLLPLESFFHTLISNSKFCTKWINVNLRMIHWKRELGCQCHRNIVDFCGCSPNDLKLGDEHTFGSHYNQPTYFARKFEAIVSNNIINEVDQEVHKDIKGIRGYGHYWQSDYHHLDDRRRDHDLFTTAINSMLRRTHKIVRKVVPECRLRRRKILDVTLMFVHDSFESYLVKYTASLPGHTEPLTFEARLDTLYHYRENQLNWPLRKLRMLQVGTNYDAKEQIFRNFAQLIGPHSEVSLRHSWEDGSDILVGFTWIDPAGIVAHYTEVTLDLGLQILHQDPKLKTPLRPGEWVIKVTYKSELIAETKFIVLPYSVYNGTRVTQEDVLNYHNGPEGHYFIGDLDTFSDAFKVLDRDELSNVADLDGQKNGPELIKWIDHLSEEVWGTQDICSTVPLGDQCLPLEICKDTYWSSLSPDPKSEINEYFTYRSLMGYYE